MTSQLNVNSIAHSNETIAATINSSGFFIPKFNIVQTVKTDTFAVNPSSNWIDITGLSVAITPTLSTSKILVQIDICGGGVGAVNVAHFRLVRGSTVIYAGAAAGNRSLGFGGGISLDVNVTPATSGTFIDAPSTTSAVTYKIQTNSNNTVFINRSSNDANDSRRLRGVSSITVMEIAG